MIKQAQTGSPGFHYGDRASVTSLIETLPVLTAAVKPEGARPAARTRLAARLAALGPAPHDAPSPPRIPPYPGPRP